MKLSKKLDSTNKKLFVSCCLSHHSPDLYLRDASLQKEDNEEKKNKQDLEKERQNYKDLVRFLSKEIEDLKTEIGLFKRKGNPLSFCHCPCLPDSSLSHNRWTHLHDGYFKQEELQLKREELNHIHR